eukprot:gene22664-27362_t
MVLMGALRHWRATAAEKSRQRGVHMRMSKRQCLVLWAEVAAWRSTAGRKVAHLRRWSDSVLEANGRCGDADLEAVEGRSSVVPQGGGTGKRSMARCQAAPRGASVVGLRRMPILGPQGCQQCGRVEAEAQGVPSTGAVGGYGTQTKGNRAARQRKILRAGFTAWQQVLVEQRATMWVTKLTRASLVSWRHMAALQRTLEDYVATQLGMRVAAAFEAWMEAVHFLLARARVLTEAMLQSATRLRLKALWAWAMARRERRRAAAYSAAQWMAAAFARQSFNGKPGACLGGDLNGTCGRARKFLLLDSFMWWLDWVQGKTLYTMRQRKVAKSWARTCLLLKAQRRKLQRVTQRWQGATLQNVVTCWAAVMNEERADLRWFLVRSGIWHSWVFDARMLADSGVGLQ